MGYDSFENLCVQCGLTLTVIQKVMSGELKDDEV